jgi:hypothetical protein
LRVSVDLQAPTTITSGTPIPFAYSAEHRVSGRVRLTSGKEALTFRLKNQAGELSEPTSGPRLRGKHGSFHIVEWGEHPEGTELVLRFEGRKIWMKVSAS